MVKIAIDCIRLKSQKIDESGSDMDNNMENIVLTVYPGTLAAQLQFHQPCRILSHNLGP